MYYGTRRIEKLIIHVVMLYIYVSVMLIKKANNLDKTWLYITYMLNLNFAVLNLSYEYKYIIVYMYVCKYNKQIYWNSRMIIESWFQRFGKAGSEYDTANDMWYTLVVVYESMGYKFQNCPRNVVSGIFG